MPPKPLQPKRPERADFLEALVADLRPVAPPPALARALTTWVGFGLLTTTLAVGALGGLREDALDDLGTPRRAVELLLGTIMLVALARAALEAGVPGAPKRARLLAPVLLFTGLWLGVALDAFPLEGPLPSMRGKRLHCFLEGLAIATLPGAVGLHLARRRSLRAGALPGTLIGMAAGAFPALAMQLACVGEPTHALRFHFTPMIFGAAALGLVGALRPAEG